jgi:membrane associated rhomboid family serine protease
MAHWPFTALPAMPLQLPPPITRALLIACTLLMFLGAAIRPVGLLELQWLALFPARSGSFWPWQVISYPFLHLDGIGWFFNMLMLYFFGSRLEELWGVRRYVQFLLACTAAAAIVYLLLTLVLATSLPLMGMSSIAFGMLVAFGILFPNQRIMLYFVAEVTMRTAVWVFIGLAVIVMIGQMFNGTGAWISQVAQLGGALGGYLMLLYWRWRPPSFKRKKPPTHIRRVH